MEDKNPLMIPFILLCILCLCLTFLLIVKLDRVFITDRQNVNINSQTIND